MTKTSMESFTKNDLKKIEVNIRRLKLLCLVWGVQTIGFVIASAAALWLYISDIKGIRELPIILHFFTPIIFAITFLHIVAIIGTLKRTSWGFYSGVFISVLFLLSSVLGVFAGSITLVKMMGLIVAGFLGLVGVISYLKTVLIFGSKGNENLEKIREACVLNEYKNMETISIDVNKVRPN